MPPFFPPPSPPAKRRGRRLWIPPPFPPIQKLKLLERDKNSYLNRPFSAVKGRSVGQSLLHDHLLRHNLHDARVHRMEEDAVDMKLTPPRQEQLHRPQTSS